MEAVFSTIGTYAKARVANIEFEDYPLISATVSTIMSDLRKAFPNLPFRCDYRDDGGVNFFIYDVNAFLSPAFGSFLDRIAAPLALEQYMLIDFVPSEPAKPMAGYAAVTSMPRSQLESFLPESTNKNNVEASIIPGILLECVYQAPVPTSFSWAA